MDSHTSKRSAASFLIVAVLAALLSAFASCQKQEGETIHTEPGVLVVGEVTLCSKIPDPKKSEYPDCLFTCELDIEGFGAATTIAPKVVLVLPAFKNRELSSTASLKPGDLIKLRLLTEKQVPENLRIMKRADDTTDLTLPVYFATSYERAVSAELAALVKSQPANANKTNSPGETQVRYPWSAKAAACRALSMNEDAAFIRDALVRHGGTFSAWQRELRPMIDDLAKQSRIANGALHDGPFYFEHLRASDYEQICAQAGHDDGPFKVLVALSRQLRARGMDFIAVPFPNKEEVNADVFSKLAPADGVFEPWRSQFLLKLIEADVEVLDLVPALRAARKKRPHLFYDGHDAHPADEGVRTATEAIAARLDRYDLPRRAGFVPQKFKSEMVGFETDFHNSKLPMRKFTATRVLHVDKLSLDENGHTPVVLLGDSFVTTPSNYGIENASIPWHLAPFLGEVPDLLSAMGGSPQIMKLLAREGPDFPRGRCVVVFVFSPARLLGGLRSTDEDDQWRVFDLPPLAR